MTEVLDLFPTLTDEQGDMRQTCHRDVDRVLAPFIAANRAREWHMDPTSGWPPRCSKKRTGQGCEPSEFPTAAAACVVGDRPGPTGHDSLGEDRRRSCHTRRGAGLEAPERSHSRGSTVSSTGAA